MKIDKRKLVRTGKFFSLGVFFGFMTVFIFYHLYFAQRIIPGVWVGNINLSGKSYTDAYKILTGKFTQFEEQNIALTVNGEKDQVFLADLGIDLLPKETLVKAALVGRNEPALTGFKTKIGAFFNKKVITPEYNFNDNLLSTQLDTFYSDLESEFIEASLTINNQGIVEFVPGKEGIVIDKTSVKDCLIKNTESLIANIECTVPLIKKTPQYSAEDFNKIKNLVEAVAAIKLELNWTGGNRTLTGAKLLDLTSVEPKGLYVSQEKVVEYVQSLAKEVDIEPVNAAFEVRESGETALFTPARKGQRLKQDKLTETVTETLTTILAAPGNEHLSIYQITVEFEFIDPEITSIENEYGIKTLLGEGKSNYHGSIPNRVYNVQLASDKLNGKLIKPGETVSFNKLLGDVSAESGYKSAYVIIGNQTILGAGGGVCQTSTTMFRAVLNAGLPVVERTAHMYRVHYYEPPLGLDATVMAPYTDFVFKNDTPAHILIQTYVNANTEDVVYQIYGTDDGRKSIVSEPVITNQTGYPNPIYKEDATIEKGRIVQVEWAAGGATAKVTRTVTRNGETLQEDTFVSNYVPWPAVFLVGSKE